MHTWNQFLCRVIPKDFKMVFTAFLIDAQHRRTGAEKEPASSLVVSLDKTF